MGGLAAAGRLEATSLPRLLLDIQRERWSGALVLSRDRTTKRILFQKGVVVFAESNLASESLGVLLLDEGKISRESYSAVVQRVQERRCKEGAALLELKLLSPRELFLALKQQVRRRILECFSWTAGEFRLEEGEAPPDDAQAFRADMVALVQDGIERHWGPERVLAELGTRLEGYPVATERLARVARRLGRDPGVQRLLEALDGRCTLGEALQSGPSPASYAAALVLDACGCLSYAQAPPGDEKPPPADERPPSSPAIEIVFSDEAAADAPPPARTPAAAPAERRPAEGVEALRKEVLERHARLAELDHYGILGLARDANPVAVKAAYFRAAKRYHPDALASLGLEAVRREANAVFARIAKAYAVLSDPKGRREYDAELAGAVHADANRLANAESLFRKGEILLKRGDFAGALQYLKPAVELWPDDATYQSAAGWALFKKTPPEVDRARQHLERAVELDDGNAQALLRLGGLLREQGEAERSKQLVARARKIDPKVDAR